MSRAQQILWAAAIVIVLGGLYAWWSSQAQPSSSNPAPFGSSASNAETSGNSNEGAQRASVPTSATVTFDGTYFSPSSVAIAQGGTVTFTSAAGPMWIASDPHPIHNGYDGTTMQQHCAPGYAGPTPLDQCSPGTTFSFRFTKVGTWGYHDHLNHSAVGSITVVAE